MSNPSPVEWALRPFKRYADFKGRAPRAEYWWFYLATLFVFMVLPGTPGPNRYGGDPYGPDQLEEIFA